MPRRCSSSQSHPHPCPTTTSHTPHRPVPTHTTTQKKKKNKKRGGLNQKHRAGENFSPPPRKQKGTAGQKAHKHHRGEAGPNGVGEQQVPQEKKPADDAGPRG